MIPPTSKSSCVYFKPFSPAHFHLVSRLPDSGIGASGRVLWVQASRASRGPQNSLEASGLLYLGAEDLGFRVVPLWGGGLQYSQTSIADFCYSSRYPPVFITS